MTDEGARRLEDAMQKATACIMEHAAAVVIVAVAKEIGEDGPSTFVRGDGDRLYQYAASKQATQLLFEDIRLGVPE